MRVFMWHVHGSYMTALVRTGHTFLLPTLPARGGYGLGRARTWDWPAGATEVSPLEAAESDVDVVVLQRPEEVALSEAWLGGRRPGVDVPAVYLEHNAPQGPIATMTHPMAERGDVPVVHVTHFNRLFWDCGVAPSRVIEHGIVDPGPLASGEWARAAAVINEPVRRARVTGADLLSPLASASGVAISLFGMQSEPLGGVDLPQDQLHRELARHRVYLHPVRWTSLGLSLIEAMHLGLPVVALATTAVADAVPSDAGVVSNDLDVLAEVAQVETAQGHRVILTGSAVDADRCRRIAADAGLPESASWAGRTNLVELAAVVAVSDLVLSSDTGIAHLASALRRPSVVVFGPVPPAEWGPPADRPIHVALWAGGRGDPHGEHIDPGLHAITVADVLAGAEAARAAAAGGPLASISDPRAGTRQSA